MGLLLSREVDAAEAMIYNEYAQVLETENPATGALYQPEDLVVIDYNDVGTAMLQDAIHARASWLAEEGNEEIATKFLAGAYKGWAFCRDNPEECVQFTVDAGSTLGLGHQNWMMNEINALIWPSPDGVGSMPTTPGPRPSRSCDQRRHHRRGSRARAPIAPTWPRPLGPCSGTRTCSATATPRPRSR